MDLDRLTAKIRHFSEAEAAPTSPFYSSLAFRMLDDPELLAIATAAPANQPMPHLLLAIAQWLLRLDGQPVLSEGPGAYDRFREVVLSRPQEVERLLATRIVQTNEVRRSLYLYLSYIRICQEIPGRGIALVELGPSAGLNLLFDRYAYRFDTGPLFGNVDSPVVLTSELRTGHPQTETPANPVVNRIGIDLSPVNIEDPAEVEWLRALIWPEHKDRLALLDSALIERRNAGVEMIAGDGVALLHSVLERIPKEIVPIVFHTHVANQLSQESREKLLRDIDEVGAKRDIVHLHNCLTPHRPVNGAMVFTTLHIEGKRIDLPLCLAEGHARWIEWLDSSGSARACSSL